jgi:hypothetical protein
VQGEGDSYLIDVFTVMGGELHEWMLHGDLSEDAAVHTNLPEAALKRKSRSIPFLRAVRTARANASWRSDLVYADGRRLRTFHLGPEASDVSLALGPAQVRSGGPVIWPLADRGRAIPSLPSTSREIRRLKSTRSPWRRPRRRTKML